MSAFPRKRVLVLTEHFAPAYKAGGIVRSLENLVKRFDEKFEFSILAGHSNLAKNEKLTSVIPNKWTDFTKHSKAFYISVRKQKANVLRSVLNAVRPDVVYINGMYSFFFTILPLLLIKTFFIDTEIVIAPNGMLHRGAVQNKPIKKNIYLWLFRLFCFHKNVKWHATDNQEKADVQRFFGRQSEVYIVPCVVSTSNTHVNCYLKKRTGQLKLVTISLITEKKGHLVLLRLLQKLPKEYNIELNLYGPVKDQEVWTACKQEINALSASIQVVYHGFLEPKDVSRVLQKHHFFVLLTHGENFCQAAFEALNVGRPLIISDQTPWRNLQDQKAGWDVCLNDSETLLGILEQAYFMSQSTFDAYCKGAKYKAELFATGFSYEQGYSELFG